MPPIRIYEIEDQDDKNTTVATYTNSTRLMQHSNVKENGKVYVPIKEIIDIKVVSSFYDETAEETRIKDYYVTRINATSIDI